MYSVIVATIGFTGVAKVLDKAVFVTKEQALKATKD